MLLKYCWEVYICLKFNFVCVYFFLRIKLQEAGRFQSKSGALPKEIFFSFDGKPSVTLSEADRK